MIDCKVPQARRFPPETGATIINGSSANNRALVFRYERNKQAFPFDHISAPRLLSREGSLPPRPSAGKTSEGEDLLGPSMLAEASAKMRQAQKDRPISAQVLAAGSAVVKNPQPN
jgi:hypothetical protein